MKIGLYFGTFNPIHIGHLAIANHMVEFSDLDEIWIVITPHSPFKKKSSLLADNHRYQLVQIATEDLYIKGLKVGDAAQTTAALGLNYKFWEKTSLTVDYNFAGDLFADYDPNDRGTANPAQAYKVPDYHLFDASLRHGFKVGDFDTTVTVRVNNVFNTEYISDALDDATDPLVWFGQGRTFSLSAKIRF